MYSRAERRMAREEQLPPAPLTTDGGIAVVLTCHGAYLPLLRDAVASIDKQQPLPAERILVLDNCDLPEWWGDRPAWTVITGSWGTPNPGRNAGLARVKSPYVVFFDADNVMPDAYLSRMLKAIRQTGPRVAIWYPDIQYTDEKLRRTHVRNMGEPGFWRLRQTNFVDTSSCWRVAALRSVGGWQDVANADDHTVALALTRQGWTCHRAGVRVIMREHELGRRSAPMWQSPGTYTKVRWQVRTHGLLTLLRGEQDLTAAWLKWIAEAALPPQTHIMAVDNGDDAHHRFLLANLPQVERITILRSHRRPQDTTRLEVLRHVANLYNDALGTFSPDLLFTLEDDVTPPLDGAWSLYETLHGEQSYQPSRIAVVGAVYENPDQPGTACLSHGINRWVGSPPLPVSPCPQRVGFIGAGFTLYAGWVLRDLLPAPIDEGAWLGWDAVVCREARRRGWEVWADGRVVADHRLTSNST